MKWWVAWWWKIRRRKEQEKGCTFVTFSYVNFISFPTPTRARAHQRANRINCIRGGTLFQGREERGGAI
jgi:hypothetical protein